jgi:aldose 1-epimerase
MLTWPLESRQTTAGGGTIDTVLTLTSRRATAQISPADGARLASLVVDGHELTLTGSSTDHPLMWGSYPMVPYAGRIRRGRFTFQGREYTLPIGLEPHAIHGTGYLAEWEVLEDGSQRHVFPPAWPFGGHAIQRVVLTDDDITFQLEVHAEQPMPVSVGWHPWWVRPVEADFRARWMYEKDPEDIPTGRLLPPPPGPWDDIFTGMEEFPRLRFPNGLTVVVESDCDHWVLYDKPSHALCVEPQSGPADALTQAPRIVEPGTPFVTWMRFRWS